MAGVVVDDVGREVQLDAERSEDVAVRDVVIRKIVVPDVEALILVSCTAYQYY